MAEGNDLMIENQIISQGIVDKRLIKAMQSIDRSLFVPENCRYASYHDGPLPIGNGQTISQPFIVAYMIDAVRPRPHEKALEIGSGSGYLACILAGLVKHVYAMEIIKPLYEKASGIIERIGIDNITPVNSNGYLGLPEHSPYDLIIVSCASREVPPSLTEQLSAGGRIIIPLEETSYYQNLFLITRDPNGTLTEKRLLPVRFVPFVRGDSVRL